MDLKTFVRETLIELDSALLEASNDPEHFNYKFWKNAFWDDSIDFEVQVYASEWTWTKGGIWINVAWIVKLWSEWESEQSQSNLSKISFTIIKEKTLKQVLKEKWEREKLQPRQKIVHQKY